MGRFVELEAHGDSSDTGVLAAGRFKRRGYSERVDLEQMNVSPHDMPENAGLGPVDRFRFDVKTWFSLSACSLNVVCVDASRAVEMYAPGVRSDPSDPFLMVSWRRRADGVWQQANTDVVPICWEIGLV